MIDSVLEDVPVEYHDKLQRFLAEEPIPLETLTAELEEYLGTVRHVAQLMRNFRFEALERIGAAMMVREDALTVDGFAQQVKQLLDDPIRRFTMAEAARSQGRPEAAAAVVDDLCSWLGHPAIEGPDANPSMTEMKRDSDESSFMHRERVAAIRKPKVKRCHLRIQPVRYSIDATG